ncbi:hypothetical protein DB31_7856 [Hyalangium minutum]|uniref:Uncharacterized protein n=1 Tax=Hyalangium minutum TaxID=394096 RepID=A0A085WLQ6_9BACT|nr:hypothetical protein DB31_7856 [Hyalangium minutum]
MGTLALGGFAVLRNAALGHAPPYSARRLAAQLVHRVTRRTVPPRRALAWSLGMRFTYGPVLGLIWARLRERLPPSPLLRGLLLGAGVLTFEHLSFPALHVTAPPRTWTRAERAFLLAQTCLFGLVTEWALPRASHSLPAARPLTAPGAEHALGHSPGERQDSAPLPPST